MSKIIAAVSVAAALALQGGADAQTKAPEPKPTIVLVHGAFAESSSWDGVIRKLNKDGYHVIAAANPLRSLTGDAAAISLVVRSVSGPVVLVGHSYGGPVITEAANVSTNVTALVYVAGFAPERGESSLSLSGKFPGSTLGAALEQVKSSDGDVDLFIQPDKFPAQFAADLPPEQARLMAVTQRPVTQGALTEASGTPSWKTLPTYMIYGTADRNIPAEVLKFMAERANARKTVVVEGASHAVMVSHPDQVAGLIEEAAKPQSWVKR